MVHDVEFSILFLYGVFLTGKANFEPMSDNIHFAVQFPGPLASSMTDQEQGMESDKIDSDDDLDDPSLLLMTHNKEKYRCIIPDVIDQEQAKTILMESYKGPDALELLRPLYEKSSCSYKIEPYWTYEFCHGKFLRQYHEEKDSGKEIKLQEYFLGRYVEKSEDEDKLDKEETEEKIDFHKVPFIQVGGIELPYYTVDFSDGTPCDLTKQPRKTHVRYVCHDLGRGEIYDLKELSTCEYEIVILTQLLCPHPLYQPLKDPINKINCHSLDGSPAQPISLVNFELENTQARYNKKEEYNIPKKVENQPRESSSSSTTTSQKETAAKKPVVTIPDKHLLRDFLDGEYCIQGGTAWWKHEFCYGKYAAQFHEENGQRTLITLGKWDEDVHLNWIEENPTKQPKRSAGGSYVVHHFYSGGDVCDLTGKPRTCEVKLKCKESPNQANSVAIYLIEPKPCEYSLVVESPILCPILTQADEDGLIIDPET